MLKTIRGIVYDKFKSGRAFANAIGWDRTKACNIINGTREPRESDLAEMSVVLEIPVEDLAQFFLGKKSQNCDE